MKIEIKRIRSIDENSGGEYCCDEIWVNEKRVISKKNYQNSARYYSNCEDYVLPDGLMKIFQDALLAYKKDGEIELMFKQSK